MQRRSIQDRDRPQTPSMAKTRMPRIEIGARDQEEPHPDAGQRQVQDKQHEVADIERGDQPPDELGVAVEQERAGLQVVVLERREQHGGGRRRRQAEREQRHQHAGGGSVVGGLRSGDAFDGAVPELLRAASSAAAPPHRTGTSGSRSRRRAARRSESRAPFPGSTARTSVANPRASSRRRRRAG